MSESEQSEIEALYQIIATQEATYLLPATERIREERRQVEANSAILASLLQRRRRLEHRLTRFVQLNP